VPYSLQLALGALRRQVARLGNAGAHGSSAQIVERVGEAEGESLGRLPGDVDLERRHDLAELLHGRCPMK